MKKTIAGLFFVILILCAVFAGCKNEGVLDPRKPVTLTLWHNYGGRMQTSMDTLVDEFNYTVGKEKGIIVSVTSVSSQADLHEKLTMIANGDPGAPQMPNLFVWYPKTALLLEDKGLIAGLDRLFTERELASYVPRFIEEGRLPDGDLYVFPVAKSTEVLFVNATLFDRFSRACAVSIEALETFEGIAQAAVLYYQWTDSLTPDIPGDGKAFYTADSWFNVAQVGADQLGGSLIDEKKADCFSDEYGKIWNCFFEPAVKGAYALFDGYSSDLSRTGDIVCSTGSTAGILFYGNKITYEDNTTEEVEYTVMPYPVFHGGRKTAVQRGGGMCVARSSPEKEYAAALFLKWFTAAEQNTRFVSSTGYLPVTHEAFGGIMEHEIISVADEYIGKMLHVASVMHEEYDFYIPPVFDGFDELGKRYERELKKTGRSARRRYMELCAHIDGDDAFAAFSAESFRMFAAEMGNDRERPF